MEPLFIPVFIPAFCPAKVRVVYMLSMKLYNNSNLQRLDLIQCNLRRTEGNPVNQLLWSQE